MMHAEKLTIKKMMMPVIILVFWRQRQWCFGVAEVSNSLLIVFGNEFCYSLDAQ
jgi:hypothetical protein